MDNEEAKCIFKLILVGDTNTGKTTICNTLLERELKEMQYQPFHLQELRQRGLFVL